MERCSFGQHAEQLAKAIRQAVKYVQYKMNMKGNSVAKPDGKIFIGHGGSSAWRDLKDFIQDRLHLPWDEFNREPTAGFSTKERLEAMLDSACFAFLVMTGEDERADGTKQARANVVHEVGLFQGRLGFERAIVLLEEGCSEFSNIIGLTQIRFPKGNIKAISEEVRRVLEREGILRPASDVLAIKNDVREISGELVAKVADREFIEDSGVLWRKREDGSWAPHCTVCRGGLVPNPMPPGGLRCSRMCSWPHITKQLEREIIERLNKITAGSAKE
jgi:predicted nucleotide-binding protein